MNSSLPATQADLEAAKTELRTDLDAAKTDLKADIEAAKTELKADVARLDAKSDRLAADQARMRGDMAAMEQRLGSLIRKESAKTAATLGAFLQKLEIYDRESLTTPKTIDEHGKILRDHEGRIASLESAKP